VASYASVKFSLCLTLLAGIHARSNFKMLLESSLAIPPGRIAEMSILSIDILPRDIVKRA